MRNAALSLSLILAACSSQTDDDLTPMYDLPQILPDETPICLSYEPTTLDETRNYTALLRNDGRQQLVIQNATLVDDQDSQFQVAGVNPMEANTFEFAHVLLRYKPTIEGWATAFLQVTSNAQNYPTLRIFILALGRPAGVDDTWDPGPKPQAAFAGMEACQNDYKPRQ